MSGNVFIPFNNKPTAVYIKGASTYTVPANKFARVLLVSKISAYGELYIKKSGGTAAYINTTEAKAYPEDTTWPITQATHTIFSVASGYIFKMTRVHGTISSSNGSAVFAWTGSSPAAGNILTIPQNSSADSGTIAVEYTGPGNITLTNNGAGNTNFSAGTITGFLYRAGEVLTTTADDSVNPASISGEIWLAAGDEISFEGGLIVDEYDDPS